LHAYYDVLFASGLMINWAQQDADAAKREKDVQTRPQGIRDALDTYFPDWQTGSDWGNAPLNDAIASIQTILKQARDTFFPEGLSEGGDLILTASQISTIGKAAKTAYEDENAPSEKSSDLYVLIGGRIDVGRTTLVDPLEFPLGSTQRNDLASKKYGIFTGDGGAVSLFAQSDIDVFESRIMTFRGGDIFAWSDTGDINAGRGSKTAISTEPPRLVWSDKNNDGDQDVGEVTLEFSPPAVGSGIRTLTYDPDGFLGPIQSPPIGDAYLYAPQGILDAGEAGIGARNLYVFAQQVRNVQNIEFTGGTALGVNFNTQAGASIGSLSGASNLSSVAKMAEEAAGMDKAVERAEKISEASRDLTPGWLDVRVEAYLEEI
jgi:hypothetical protein